MGDLSAVKWNENEAVLDLDLRECRLKWTDLATKDPSVLRVDGVTMATSVLTLRSVELAVGSRSVVGGRAERLAWC